MAGTKGRPNHGHPEYCRVCGGSDWVTQKDRRARCRDCRLAYYRHHRMEVILSYGGKCSCCTEWRYEFLGIDHIGGGGNIHRKEIPSSYLYKWLMDNNFPEGFQVLCHNCNLAHGFYGYCPHKEEKIVTN